MVEGKLVHILFRLAYGCCLLPDPYKTWSWSMAPGKPVHTIFRLAYYGVYYLVLAVMILIYGEG